MKIVKIINMNMSKVRYKVNDKVVNYYMEGYITAIVEFKILGDIIKREVNINIEELTKENQERIYNFNQNKEKEFLDLLNMGNYISKID